MAKTGEGSIWRRMYGVKSKWGDLGTGGGSGRLITVGRGGKVIIGGTSGGLRGGGDIKMDGGREEESLIKVGKGRGRVVWGL